MCPSSPATAEQKGTFRRGNFFSVVGDKKFCRISTPPQHPSSLTFLLLLQTWRLSFTRLSSFNLYRHSHIHLTISHKMSADEQKAAKSQFDQVVESQSQFKNIGDVVEKGDGDDEDLGPMSVESLCMNCHENVSYLS